MSDFRSWTGDVDLGRFRFRPDGGFPGGAAWTERGDLVFLPPGRLPPGVHADRPEEGPKDWERRSRAFHQDRD